MTNRLGGLHLMDALRRSVAERSGCLHRRRRVESALRGRRKCCFLFRAKSEGGSKQASPLLNKRLGGRRPPIILEADGRWYVGPERIQPAKRFTEMLSVAKHHWGARLRS
jgi:hypothetical protein